MLTIEIPWIAVAQINGRDDIGLAWKASRLEMEEMDDELLFLLHSANIDEQNDLIVMKKLEVCYINRLF